MSEGAVVVTATPVLGVALGAAVERCGYLPTTRAASAEGLRVATRARSPALALVDLATPRVVPVVRDICGGPSAPVVVVLADEDQDDIVVRLVSAGVVGAIPRAAAWVALERALTAVRQGQAVVPRSLVGRVLAELRLAASGAQQAPTSVLTRREQQILDMMRAGFSTSAIATRLVVAPVTVRTHVCAIRRKLHLEERAEAPPLRAG